ncbi:hypothetical protein M011DRAFT_410735 [Sporormia fimetaria CBS 119925]|uniref:Ecp2 effector protein-like domain-containing protein n=1 Tax=Sporormia fimetaria CBS 119925 TaxID=1340428 RepID=A0A6A6V0W1_9PLEO|nr:hypothetical protein M011DRAFT_410735 [Sporormia fimetaria CBS 119925]
MGEFASTSTANKRCGTSSFVSDTASDSAYTGGCHAIREWAEANPGFWDLPSGNMKILVYGGSNSGANCVFAAQRGTDVTSSPRIGNTDVADFLRGSHSRFATFFNGAQRLAAHGSTVCSGVDSVERGVDWYIFPTARIV